MSQKRACDAKETEILDNVAAPRISNKLDYTYYFNTEASLPKEFEFNKPKHDPRKLSHNFLKTWFWTTNIAEDDGTGFIRDEVSGSPTSWQVTGFSIHPDYGFALAQPQELIVNKKLFIELNLDRAIRNGEVLELDFTIFNFLPEDVTAKLKVYSLDDDGQQFDFLELSGDVNRCSFTKKDEDVFQKTIRAEKNVGTNEQVFIQPKVNKKMKIRAGIKAMINGKTYEDYIEKSIESEGVYEYETKKVVFNSTTHEQVEKTLSFKVDDINLSSVELKAVVTGNMMTGALKKDQTKE
jgi:hypothetical protein